mgnify:CR=1 FL=1|tara:strand:+ start:1872 stop:2042 length:171 start_codon:yes stop_codon:yes gene_type:complete
MKIFFIIAIFLLISCSNTNKIEKLTEIDFDQNLSFNEFKNLIEKKSSEKEYPDINK